MKLLKGTTMRAIFAGLALLVPLAAAYADLPPTPDAGPFAVSVAGLDFKIMDVHVKYPPGYYKTFPMAVLTGCKATHANCRLAKAKNLIGMEVQTANGEYLKPEQGQLHMLQDAFAHAKGPVTLELYRRESGETAKVDFARR